MRLFLPLLIAALAPATRSEVSASYEKALALLKDKTGSSEIADADLRSTVIENKRVFRLCGRVLLSRPTQFIVELPEGDISLSSLSGTEMIRAERKMDACHNAYTRWARGDSITREQALQVCQEVQNLGELREAEARFRLLWAVLCEEPADTRHPFVR